MRKFLVGMVNTSQPRDPNYYVTVFGITIYGMIAPMYRTVA